MLAILLYIFFVLAAIVLIVVILLQEGRGGGFGQALGEHGQQTFGVKAQGIHKFTMWVAVFFLASAVTLHVLNRNVGDRSVFDTTVTPADPTQQK
jgi:preprotein translocase subunit SecG